ncbi:histidyl-tRNA mitochondrial precursor [Durotheca rogersii]|uniref:histidyl-tRNA mitochondrial precursor n=1 Tax=Durotheca rogersii TaxID=419775 RepID=UPI002220459B|nr:histidyl-tRNA mitochondrial precursor [Durotheca rogersii]KAI5863327.1 histidyl-tRNA mitochondrial precursor [Durotheca rogersii]
MATSEAKSTRSNVQLKTPKGTRDWVGPDLVLREHIFRTVSDVFKRHGGTPLDTPVFELRGILTEKYGEDSRLIYDLEDQGGELCSLRYDLTVPFARWLAMNTNITQIKRYQIAKVYRRDQPAIARGRLREFYQCDFDIAGVYDPMIPDAEVLRVIIEVFEALELEVSIKINHRQILDGLFAVAGVPDEKVRLISSAVDKLDKAPWDDVKKEMVEEKGLPEEVADRIGKYVGLNGDLRKILELLQSDETLSGNKKVQAGLKDMGLLVPYLEALDVIDKVSFDLSLARGLDYYSGVIYEVLTKPPSQYGPGAPAEAKSDGLSSQVGSIAAGGRYDNLVGMFGKRPMPCIGVSFGVDRIFTILDARRGKKAGVLTREIDVYVMAFGGKDTDGLLLERMAIARQLWNAGIRAEFAAKVKAKLPQQFKAAKDVPLAVIIGQDELADGLVRLKVLGAGDGETDEKDRGQLISKDNLVTEVKKLL